MHLQFIPIDWVKLNNLGDSELQNVNAWTENRNPKIKKAKANEMIIGESSIPHLKQKTDMTTRTLGITHGEGLTIVENIKQNVPTITLITRGMSQHS